MPSQLLITCQICTVNIHASLTRTVYRPAFSTIVHYRKHTYEIHILAMGRGNDGQPALKIILHYCGIPVQALTGDYKVALILLNQRSFVQSRHGYVVRFHCSLKINLAIFSHQCFSLQKSRNTAYAVHRLL